MAGRHWQTRQWEQGHKPKVLEHVSLPQFFVEKEGLAVCTGMNSSPLGTANENLRLEETFCHGALQPCSIPGGPACPAILSCCLQMSRDNQSVHRLEIQGGMFKRVPEGHGGLDQPSSVLPTPPKYPQLHKLLFVCSKRAKPPPSQSIPSLAGIP